MDEALVVSVEWLKRPYCHMTTCQPIRDSLEQGSGPLQRCEARWWLKLQNPQGQLIGLITANTRFIIHPSIHVLKHFSSTGSQEVTDVTLWNDMRHYETLCYIIRCYDKFWDFMMHYEMIWDFMVCYAIILWYETLWEVMGWFEMLWEFMLHYEMIWDVMGHYGTLWDVMRRYETIWDVMRQYETLR